MTKPLAIKEKGSVVFGGLFQEEVVAAFSSRQEGNMSLCYGDTALSLENRRLFLGNFNIDYRHLTCAKQAHASNVGCVSESDKGKGALSYDTAIADTDGFITDRKNIPLAIFTADCLSIFLFDRKNQAIGLIHAGWRSTRQAIISKAISLMQENFGTNPDFLYVGLGPAIRSCCYRVSEEFVGFFPGGVLKKVGHYYLDLVGINKRQMFNSGVKEKSIFDSGICTSCNNEEYFSFRKESKACGRMISAMMLK
jgi:YfiH family protein